MSWLSSWWDKASGANQKVDPNKLGTQYDDAMLGVNRGYDKISEFASGMMDPYSQQNMAMRSMMNQQGADAAAQGARLGDRSAAMAGGAPAAALAAQSSAGANQAMAGSNQAFNQYLSGAQGQGAGMLSGVLANQGQMQDRKFNMMQSQRQANAMADTQGAQFGANLLGQAIGMIPGLGGLPGGQTGGHVGYQEGGEGMAYDNIDSEITFYEEGGSVGPQYGPDGKPRFLLGGLLAGTFALGALKKGYNALGGGKGGESISESLGRAKDWGAGGLDEMKKEAKDTNFYYTKEGAEDAMMEKYLKTDEGKTGSDLAKEVSDDELSLANIGKNKDYDEDFQTREMLSKDKHQAFLDKERANFDTSQGDDRVGAGRALGENIGAVTGPIVSSIAEGAGLLGKAAVGTAGAIKKDWQKEKGSIGKGLLKGGSELLKEIGSPGYLQGKEMAQIKRLGKDRDLKLDKIVPVPEAITKSDEEESNSGEPSGVAIPDSKGGNLLDPTGDKKSRKEDISFNTEKPNTPPARDIDRKDPTDVTGAQEKLINMGYDIGSTGADGEWGDKSKAAYLQYQADLESGKIDKEGIYQFGSEYIKPEPTIQNKNYKPTNPAVWTPNRQQGGLIGMQEGGDPREYRAQLEGSDAEWQSKLESNLYTPEGDYTKEGLLGQYGFSNEAVVDTSYGGQSPNQAVGMNIREGDRNMRLDFDAHNRWEGDKELSESRIKGEWFEADRAAGRGYTFGEGYHPDSYAEWSTQKMKDEGYQEGGTVWNQDSGQNPNNQVSGGILSQVMGPKGPMNIPTRIGGFRVTG